MPRRAFTLAILLAALLGLAACGDKGPSKEEFLAQLDPICKRGNEIAVVFTTPSDVPMIKDFATKVADNTDKTAAEAEKLDFPKGEDGTAAKDVVKSLRDAAASARAINADVDAKKYPAIEAGVTKMVDGFKAADTKARDFGSKECGRGEAEVTGKLASTVGATVKTAYIAQADAICATANKELDAIPEPDTLPEVKASLEKGAAVIEKAIADVKAIPQPTVDSAKLTDAITANDAALAKFKEGIAFAQAGDERKLERWLDEFSTAADTAEAKFDAYGFKDCGSQGE